MRHDDSPAGGCVVPVNCMTATAVAQDIELQSHSSSCIRFSEGKRPNNFVTQTPINAPKKCPPMRARGCANGVSIAPYMSTALAPLKIWSFKYVQDGPR